MSRNLCRTDCYFCQADVLLVEEPRPATEKDVFCYMDEYEGMLVANAECPECKAKYLAWVDERPRTSPLYHLHDRWPTGEATHVDLSFRSTFDDEPGVEDLPMYEIKVQILRERVPVKRHGCGAPLVHGYCYACYTHVDEAAS